jgi:acetyl esterase/lipase
MYMLFENFISRFKQYHPEHVPRYSVANLKAFWIVFGVLFFIGCSDSDEFSGPDPSEELTVTNVSYGTDPRNTMDIFLPKNRTKETKAVVFIHGGGWKEGSKEELTSMATKFADNGYASIAINYRYANVQEHISYVEMMADIDAALAFLKTKSAEYTFNADQITLFGHSAGAHLALLYAYRNNERSQVRSVISLAAPTDLPALLEVDVFPALLYNLVGSEELEKYEDASPIDHVGTGVVPTYCFHGKADTSIPYQQAEKLYAVLEQKNTLAHRLKLFEDVGHEFSTETYMIIVSESLAFID